MNTNTAKRSFKDRVKSHAPEILIGAGVVMTAAGVLLYRNELIKSARNYKPAFLAAAADPSIEIVAGNEDAFVVMTTDALETLEKFGKLDIGDKTAIRYVLSLVADK